MKIFPLSYKNLSRYGRVIHLDKIPLELGTETTFSHSSFKSNVAVIASISQCNSKFTVHVNFCTFEFVRHLVTRRYLKKCIIYFHGEVYVYIHVIVLEFDLCVCCYYNAQCL